LRYCCRSGFSYCGDTYYCSLKPAYYRACDGIIIAGGVLIGCGLLFAFGVFIMFCNFRTKLRNAGGYYAFYNPIIPSVPAFGQPNIQYYQNYPQGAQNYNQNVSPVNQAPVRNLERN